jgi:hypothetical protein
MMKDLRECTWVITKIFRSVMIIHQRGASVICRVFPNRNGITLKGSMTCKIFFGTFGIVGVLTRERGKSSAVIRKLFVGFRKGFGVMPIK